MKMNKVRITVVKRLSSEDIHGDADPGCSAEVLTPQCPAFEEGQQFVVGPEGPPPGFCQGAWADIYRHITVLRWNGAYPWMDQPDKYLACCTDGFRPTVFLLERLEEEDEVTGLAQ
jgi:uncharacterized repeat protein (TIGR04076 family)